MKGRTQAIAQLQALVLTGPAALCRGLAGRSTRQLLGTCRRSRADRRPAEAADPVTAATEITLRRPARRIATLAEGSDELAAESQPLVAQTAPVLLAVDGVGTEVGRPAADRAGDDPGRLRSEAAFARRCGTAPLPAIIGRTTGHRLNRGGDRHAGYALRIIAPVRLSSHQPTQAHAARRRAGGMGNLGERGLTGVW